MPKILVIDDEKDVRETILMALESEGYETLGAGDGNKGLELAKSQQPDMILCDLMMPNLSGFETLAALRNETSTASIPLVFLTGFNDPFSKERGAELGMDGFLEKPVALNHLLGVVRYTLKKASERRAKQKRP